MSDTFRFVVTFRREQGKEAITASTWRGWIELIYPESCDNEKKSDRRYFIHLDESSELMAEMIKDAGGPDAS